MIVRYLSHFRATNAPASLRKCADSPEPSKLAHTKMNVNEDLDQSLGHQHRLIRQDRRLKVTFSHLCDTYKKRMGWLI